MTETQAEEQLIEAIGVLLDYNEPEHVIAMAKNTVNKITKETRNVTDRIRIETKDGRNPFRYHVVVEPSNTQQTIKPAAFNARGDAVAFALELARRLEKNLGHRTEVIGI